MSVDGLRVDDEDDAGSQLIGRSVLTLNVRAVAIRIVVAGRRPVRIRRGRHAGGKQTCRDDDGGDEGADDDEGDGRYGQRGI